jgi:predicted nucleic acid-binding protein
MRQGEAAFVDSGAWIALALSRDPLHSQAREQWELLHGAGAKLSVPFPWSSRHSHFSIVTPIGMSR